VKLKENENKNLISGNEELLQEQKKCKERHTDFIIENSNQIKEADNINEELKTKIQFLYSRLREKKNFLEKSIQNTCYEYNQFCDKKFQICNDKNQNELKNLEKTLTKSLDHYLENSGKRLFEFNAAVQADAKDLSTVPNDMKEYDQNPLKTVVFIPNGNPNMKIINY